MEYLQDSSLGSLVAFFRAKGLEALKREDRREDWYPDWIAYQAEHGLYASLLSPARYSTRGHRFDVLRLARVLEAFGYFAPAHAYSLHVTFLGLFPILSSSNEPLKREAIAKLEGGGLFGFAVSEREHGSDLFANEFTLHDGATGMVANGSKCYIGNANAACMLTVLAKKGDGSAAARRAPFVFFALRPEESPGLRDLRKVRTLGIRSAFVGEFAVRDHPVPEGDVVAVGREAWNAAHGAVTLGKFFLGFGAVGVCEHAFVEAVEHMRRRALYGKSVTDMPHVRAATVEAFARLAAMKLYAYRALDYLQVASDDDRRYLLFHAVQKARVSTEGVKVMGLLSECMGARGFDADTYFESALRDSAMVPGLESSAHINFGLTAQFAGVYFGGDGDVGEAPGSTSLGTLDRDENPYWLSARDRNPKTVRFGNVQTAFESLRSLPNVRSFVKQARSFRQFVAAGVSALDPAVDLGQLIAVGKCVSIVVYAQLVAENSLLAEIPPSVVSVAFRGLIEDLNAEALVLAATYPSGSLHRGLLKRVVRVPRTDAVDHDSVFDLLVARYAA